MAADKLGKSFIFKGFQKKLIKQLSEETAALIWQSANINFCTLERQYSDIVGDSRMMILPSAALHLALQEYAPEQVGLLKEYGTEMGKKIAGLVHAMTSIPGVPRLLWKNMPTLMRKMSSPEAGYTRRIVSENSELVGVDILTCPLYDAAAKIGVPEAALVVCAMDKAYMTGFKHIRYTRTTSVAEGDECCDYRLVYDKDKT